LVGYLHNGRGAFNVIKGCFAYFVQCAEPPAKIARIDDFDDLCDPKDLGLERSELSDYVNLKVSKDTDMMQFWSDNKSLFPKLFSVVRRVLCIPASSAASERVFSTAGRLLDKRRSTLSSNNVNDLLFLHSNM